MQLNHVTWLNLEESHNGIVIVGHIGNLVLFCLGNLGSFESETCLIVVHLIGVKEGYKVVGISRLWFKNRWHLNVVCHGAYATA